VCAARTDDGQGGEALHVRDPARWREGRVSEAIRWKLDELFFLSISLSSGGHFGAKMGAWELFLMLFEGIVSGNSNKGRGSGSRARSRMAAGGTSGWLKLWIYGVLWCFYRFLHRLGVILVLKWASGCQY
jgi:hypothetical protein